MTRRVGTIVLAAVVVAGVVAFLASSPDQSSTNASRAGSAEDRTLVIATRDDPSAGGFDPDFGGASSIHSELIKNTGGQWVQYERKPTDQGYLEVDPTKFTPDLLESWEMAPDNLSADLVLRKGLVAHNGDELTTKDVGCWLDRAFAAEGGSAWDFQTGGVPKRSNIKITGDYTFTISFEKPAPLFLPLMRDQSVSLLSCDWSKHKTESDPLAKKHLAEHDLRPGEYKVVARQPGTQVVLEWDENYPGPKPYFTRIVLKAVPSASDRALLLRSGDVDIAADLSGDDLKTLRDVSGVKLWSIPSRSQVILGMNHDRRPFDDVRVRQAIAHAVPSNDVLEAVYDSDGQLSEGGPVPRESVWQTDVPWPYNHDLERARELLKQAGVQDGMKFTIGVNASSSQQEATAVLIKSALAELGVTASIRKDPEAVFTDQRFKGGYDAWVDDGVNAFVDSPYYYLFIFYKSDIYCCNFQKYADPTVDKLTETLATTVEEERIRPLWRQAVEAIVADAPSAFILDRNWVIATRDDITGIVAEPDGLLSYRELKRG